MDCISIPFQCVKCEKMWAISKAMELKFLKQWYDEKDLKNWHRVTPKDCIKTECVDCQLAGDRYIGTYESINNYNDEI